MAEESTTMSSLSARLKKHFKEPSLFCKIIELILCVIAMGLVAGPFQDSQTRPYDINYVAIFHVAVCGYVFINVVLIMGHLLGEKLPKKTALIFTTMGMIMCGTAGIVLLCEWNNFSSNLIRAYLQEYKNRIMAAGVFAILAAVVFAIDTYFTNKYD